MSDSAQATDRTSSSSTLSAVVLATSTVADLFSDDTQSTLIGSFATFADALAAASDDNAIVVTDPGAVGNVGAVTVDVENLTVIAASPFYANFSLGQNIVEFTLGGTTDSDIIGTSQPILRKNIITGSDGGNVITPLSGGDTVDAGGGNDIVDGANGSDVIDGGGGNDSLIGSFGADTLLGAPATTRSTEVTARISSMAVSAVTRSSLAMVTMRSTATLATISSTVVQALTP